MQREIIYFDHNATTPLLNTVKEAMCDIMGYPLNASALHHYGRKAKQILETARSRILNFSGASDKYNLVFTSTGTEGNNLALQTLKNLPIICSAIEHVSVSSVAKESMLPVLRNGLVDLFSLEKICASQTEAFIISIIAANNETGVIQPLKEIAEIVHRYSGLLHSDATQAFGKIPFSIQDLDLDIVTISGHKFGGPLGAAAIIFKKNLELKPLMHGGGQEFRYRPGTHNLYAIHGFGIAAELAFNNISDYAKISKLRDYIENQIKSASPQSVIFSQDAPRLPNTLSITMPFVNSETQVIHFDINSFAVSAGSACSSGRVDIPRVQMNMGYDEDVARTSLRISLGMNNTMEEARSFIKVWLDLFNNSNAFKNAA